MASPIVRRAVGSTRSIARVPRRTPKSPNSWRGTIADHWPALTCETRLKIELVSMAGTGLAPTDRNTPSMIRRFCMSGVNRHRGASSRLAPGHSRPIGEGAGRRRQKYIFLEADRLGPDVSDRLGVEVGEADVELEIVDAALDVLAREGKNRDGHAGEAGAERAGELPDDWQGGRNGSDAKTAGEALAALLQSGAKIFGLGQNALGMFENDPPLRRQADIAMPALDDRSAEILLEQANRRRQSWL